MSASNAHLSDVEWSDAKWATVDALYLRAVDSRSDRSILNDHAAAEAMMRIDYDVDKRNVEQRGINPFLLAVRARQLDLWAADFLARHPDATVLHLGCGLDSRPYRIDLPPDVRWFDLDLPDVIELRRKLYPSHRRLTTIGASAIDPAWVAEIPTGGPVLIIAEGLLMLFTRDEVQALLRRLMDRFDGGELIFDGLAPWVIRLSSSMQWPVRDAREIKALDRRLRLVDEVSLVSHHAVVPVRRYRVALRLMNTIPVTRKMARQFRFAF
jgi:O-methyltransferase involved in polyketide biosynthesis